MRGTLRLRSRWESKSTQHSFIHSLTHHVPSYPGPKKPTSRNPHLLARTYQKDARCRYDTSYTNIKTTSGSSPPPSPHNDLLGPNPPPPLHHSSPRPHLRHPPSNLNPRLPRRSLDRASQTHRAANLHSAPAHPRNLHSRPRPQLPLRNSQPRRPQHRRALRRQPLRVRSSGAASAGLVAVFRGAGCRRGGDEGYAWDGV